MKKSICLILASLLFLSAAVAFAAGNEEITFHGIPWLSDENITFEYLSDILYQDYTVKHVAGEEGLVLQKDDFLNARPITTRNYPNVVQIISLADCIKDKIAGYVVNDILLSYAYNGSDSKLICVKVDLVGSKYNDLVSKLDKVYGKGTEGIDEEGIKTMIWKGSNNSCVLLYSIDGEAADLVYGYLDAEDVLIQSTSDMIKNVDPDDVSGL